MRSYTGAGCSYANASLNVNKISGSGDVTRMVVIVGFACKKKHCGSVYQYATTTSLHRAVYR